MLIVSLVIRTKISIETLPSDGLVTSYSLNTPVHASVFVVPDTSLALINHVVGVISPSESICESLLIEPVASPNSGVETNNVAVK